MADKNKLSKVIGIIGGGQLGKMMILEAKKMGFKVVILDPVLNCPAHSISDWHIVSGFDDSEGIKKLAGMADVLTYEFEHIDFKTLQELEKSGKPVYPSPKSLKIIQNKLEQKRLLKKSGIPVPEFSKVTGIEDMYLVGEKFGYPFMLKSCTGGYDGKGNVVVASKQDAKKAYESLGGGKFPLMAEKFVSFDMEVSALACRALDGQTVVYPIAQNMHCDSILKETRVPAGIPEDVVDNCVKLAAQVMEVFEGIGMFCVEMFVEGKTVLVNEVAPRPHNSGHFSIEACVTSQFEQHIRAVSGLPLGCVGLLKPVVMVNLLGEEGYEGKSITEGAEEVLKIPGLALHIYGKEETKPKRKMGHITVLADTVEEAAGNAEKALGQIKIIGEKRV